MKQIKTIAICNDAAKFDEQVNKELEAGFILVRRYATRLVPALSNGAPAGVYYAELEKETEPKAAAAIETAMINKDMLEARSRKRTAKANG